MRVLKFLLQKEFLQIFRNKGMLPIIFIMPVIQLVILSFAATFELKTVGFELTDLNRSQLSESLVSKFESTGYFKLRNRQSGIENTKKNLRNNTSGMVLHIPPDFDRQILSGKSASVQVIIDAVDGTTAGLIQAYSQAIISDFSKDLQLQSRIISAGDRQAIEIIPSNWYNPNLDYINYMVPGLLVVLVSMIGMFLSGMNIVREKEIGTIEQLNVTPISKYQFIIGKLMPLWIIGMFEFAVGLIIAAVLFQIPFLGSVPLIFLIAGIYLLGIQGMGLFISTVTDTQQQAMFIAWFFMVVFILMGGLFTPLESMPLWAQQLNWINPISHFIKIMRMVLLKGSGFIDIIHLTGVLLLMALVILPASVIQYRKTTG